MFNGQPISYGDDGWFHISPNGRNGLSFKFATTGILWRHVFEQRPNKAILAAFNYQAKKFGHSKARIEGNYIIYPNVGTGFIAFCYEHGWQDFSYILQKFVDHLVNMWPQQITLAVKVSDIAVTESGQTLCVDWKRAIVGESKVIKTFPTREAYEQYIIECLQGSLLDFFKNYGDEIDRVQLKRETVYCEPHVERPPASINWQKELV